MESFSSIIWIVLFLALIVGVVLNALYASKYVSLLRLNFPDQWSCIKNEDAILGEIKTQSSLLKFILSKNYLKLDDSELTKQGNRLRMLLLIYAPLFILFFFLTLAILLL